MSKETVVKIAKRENPYVQIDKTVFEDDNLSWESKGMMGYLLSRPNDWKIKKPDLVNRSTNSVTSVETILIELMSAGYIHFYQERDDDGTFGKYVYMVFELPELNPFLEESIKLGKERMEKRKEANRRKNAKKKEKVPKRGNPVTEEKQDEPKRGNPFTDAPHTDNHPPTNIDTTNNDFTKNDFISSSSIDQSLREEFPNVPFDEVKEGLLKDESVVIETEKQYTAMLRYRLGVWKPKKAKRKGKAVRVEKNPDWFKGNSELAKVVELAEQEKAEREKDIDWDEERRKLEEELKEFKK